MWITSKHGPCSMSMRANSHQNGASGGHSAPKGDPRVAASGSGPAALFGSYLWPLSVAVICGSGLWQPAPQGPTPPARQPWRDPLKSRHAPSPRVLGRRATTLCGLSGLSGLCWIFWAPCAARSDGTRQTCRQAEELEVERLQEREPHGNLRRRVERSTRSASSSSRPGHSSQWNSSS